MRPNPRFLQFATKEGNPLVVAGERIDFIEDAGVGALIHIVRSPGDRVKLAVCGQARDLAGVMSRGGYPSVRLKASHAEGYLAVPVARISYFEGAGEGVTKTYVVLGGGQQLLVADEFQGVLAACDCALETAGL